MRAQKRAIRADVRARLASVDAGAAATALEGGLAALESSGLWARAASVLAYLATDDEPSIDGLIERGLRSGMSVAAPRMDWDAGTMRALRLRDLGDVEVRRHGVREPIETGDVEPLDLVGLVLVPGVAFDKQGGRLGRGAGFYDRFLAGMDGRVVKLGVAHEAQIVEHVPMETHDVRLDGLVTGGGLMLLPRDTGSEA